MQTQFQDRSMIYPCVSFCLTSLRAHRHGNRYAALDLREVSSPTDAQAPFEGVYNESKAETLSKFIRVCSHPVLEWLSHPCSLFQCVMEHGGLTPRWGQSQGSQVKDKAAESCLLVQAGNAPELIHKAVTRSRKQLFFKLGKYTLNASYW